LPQAVCVTDERASRSFTPPAGVAYFAGPNALQEALSRVDYDLLVNGVVGAAGLVPSYTALSHGRSVATANKESLVIGGELLTRTAAAQKAQIIPIDSEHSAIWQCLRAGAAAEVEKLWLTASGGPFRTRPLETFEAITVEEALGHPTWKMGGKITIDSATMMNKGFEIIEARWLFEVAPERIEVVIHPESIVHSAVCFVDGSVVAQLGHPDMQLPIQYALLYPERSGPPFKPLDLKTLGTLHFGAPEPDRFPALRVAREALAAGGAAPVVLNAANEVAVAAFLKARISFPAITQVVAAQLDTIVEKKTDSIDDILAVDLETRNRTSEWLERHLGVSGNSLSRVE